MLSADLRHVVAAAAREAGYPAERRDAGLRDALRDGLRDGGAPGRYLSVLPLRLASRPTEAAATMAAILRAVAWIEDARAAGNGYLTITVTPEALTEVAVRVTEAGPACARSDALAGTRAAAPPGTPLTAEHSWPEARQLVIAQVTARLAAAAGATVAADHDAERPEFPVAPSSGPSPLRDAERAEFPVASSSGPSLLRDAERAEFPVPPSSGPSLLRDAERAEFPVASSSGPSLLRDAERAEFPVAPSSGPSPLRDAERAGFPVIPAPGPRPVQGAGIPATPPGPTPVAEAVAFAGLDAIAYILARIPPERPVAPDPAAWARHVPANPAYAVRYAHSCAASTLRWAAALDLATGEAAAVRPGSLAHPRERALLTALSWLPEQVARAARRGRPHEFTLFLEELAETYQVCRVACPAWPERGHDGAHRDGLPGDARTVRARLWLTRAAATGLAAGLALLGVGAPSRL